MKPLILTAPIPVHGHPQLSAYTDGAQVPVTSAQMHWSTTGQIVPVGDMSLSHTHVDVRTGLYREVTGPFRVDFSITLHNNPGYIDAQYGLGMSFAGCGNQGVTDLVWDIVPPGHANPPTILQGLIGQDFTWEGHYTLDPTIVNDLLPHHGWLLVQFSAITNFPDNASFGCAAQEAVYSLVDPTNPFIGFLASPRSAANVWGGSVAHPEERYAFQYSEVEGYLPVLPIDQPWSVPVASYVYGAEEVRVPPFLPTQNEYRTDFDFHHGVPGIVQWTETTSNASGGGLRVFDPAVLGPGPHKLGFIRNETTAEQQLVTLLVTSLTVGASVPPPPPPPPPPTPTPITLSVSSTNPPYSGTVNGTELNGLVTITSGTLVRQ